MSFIFTQIDEKRVSISWDKSVEYPESISIPEKTVIDGKEYVVSEVANDGFLKYTKAITIPQTITRICDFGFDLNCWSVFPTLPDSLESIGKWSFSTGRFKNFTVPRSLRSIGEGSFSFNLNLEQIFVASENKYFVTVSNNILYDKKMTMIVQTTLKLTKLCIPSSVKKLCNGSFVLTFIEELYIPASVKEVGYQCFYGSNKLKNVIIAGDLSIDEKAFQVISELNIIYYGRKKVTNTIFSSDKNIKISTCFGYPLTTFGNKDITYTNSCYPISNDQCTVFNNKRRLLNKPLSLYLS